MSVRIGLEIHVQLNTLRTKLFCSTPSDYHDKPPNTLVCPVCLGMPGTLPVVNRRAIEAAIMVALALNCEIAPRILFVRKHYFYPDLPKNYQISQYDGPGMFPYARKGWLRISAGGRTKIVRIRRINIEEDPGKLTYPTGSMLTSPYSLVDYNRSGMPLLEIVTEPDMESPQEARAFVEKLIAVLDYLGVCDHRKEGAFRVDANVSIEGGARVEIKNIGSAKDVERALEFEIARQRSVVASGGKVRRETRHWDPVRKVTVPIRIKEVEEDYRYFPDPDLPPIDVPRSWIEEIAEKMPELPDQRIERFVKQYGIDEYRAAVLVLNKRLADLFEECAKMYRDYKKLADWLITDFLRWVKDLGIDLESKKVEPIAIVKLLRTLDEGRISIRMAKELLPKVIAENLDVEEYIKRTGMEKISDVETLKRVIEEVFRENPKAVKDALKNKKAVNFLVGAVMRKTRGRADPQLTVKLIEEKLREIAREI
ncbi:MAG: Asp-tRNA(Asn)/Glu-tRNA(Gln) amidotransferase subunit GatB [Crenarchaeota archaeon]|nr:Asp-tRNA(Asn)/Glu-tRNA(Gln) amidotransferase subunit GatB [Thermoproteota archaeon]